MPKKVEQEQNNNQQVNFNNGNLIEKTCEVLVKPWHAKEVQTPGISIVIYGGIVTQVICQHLSRDGKGKCQFKNNEGKDCYFLPPNGGMGTVTVSGGY